MLPFWVRGEIAEKKIWNQVPGKDQLLSAGGKHMLNSESGSEVTFLAVLENIRVLA